MSLRLLVAVAAMAAVPALAAKTTVCTITVNSADEREVLRQQLPGDRYEFVELVERGRPDWLAASCRRQVSCDVLVVSGHFAGTEFYSSRFDVEETLPVDEMERAICSEGCPSLFSRLKEVYLFGCDTLKPEPVRSATPEIIRGLLREGQARPEAERLARQLSERHTESSRDLMRRLFANVPVVYGFSSLAPLGRVAGPMLRRHFEGGGVEAFGSGRPSDALLKLFAPSSMVVTQGQREDEPNADFRREICGFYDDRHDVTRRAAFLHGRLGADTATMRMSFDRVERIFSSLDPTALVAARDAFAARADDAEVRRRFIHATRSTEDPALRVRMIALARRAGWLGESQEKSELTLAVRDVIAREMSFGEVDLICALNRDDALMPALGEVSIKPSRHSVAHDAALACLGDAPARVRVLRALASADDGEVQAAQSYLRQRPIHDVAELRALTAEVSKMKPTLAQARALETLARHHVADREIVQELARLFARTPSPYVQSAIAEVFLRSDPRIVDSALLLPVLRRHRLKSPPGSQDLIGTLIGRLQS